MTFDDMVRQVLLERKAEEWKVNLCLAITTELMPGMGKTEIPPGREEELKARAVKLFDEMDEEWSVNEQAGNN